MAKSSNAGSKTKSSNKRTLIAPNRDKRYIKRDEKGQIKESDDQEKSLSQDVKQTAKNKVKPVLVTTEISQRKKLPQKRKTNN